MTCRLSSPLKVRLGKAITQISVLCVGTIPFSQFSFLENLGTGIYLRWKRATNEQELFTEGPEGNRVLAKQTGENTLPKGKGEYSVFSIGIEFGQFSGGGGSGGTGGTDQNRKSSKISYSAALGYHEYGVAVQQFTPEGALGGINNAPFLEIGISSLPYLDIFENHRYFGPKKREITTHFLGWYTAYPGLNLGLTWNTFLQPELKGVDESHETKERDVPIGEASEVGVESYRAVLSVFCDYDFFITDSKETNIGILRLSPNLEGSYHTEKAAFDAKLGNGTVDNEEIFIRLGISF